MIITPTLVITVLSVFLLTSWAVVKGEKEKKLKKLHRKKEKEEQLIFRKLTDPYKNETSESLQKLINEAEGKEDYDLADALIELKRMKDGKEMRVHSRELAVESFSNWIKEMTQGVFSFAVIYTIVAGLLYAFTLIIPALTFSWLFVFIAAVAVSLACYVRYLFKLHVLLISMEEGEQVDHRA